MGAPDVLQHLRNAGLTLLANGDQLTVTPRARLTDGLRQTIRAHKAALIASLAPQPCPTAPSEPGPDRYCWPHSEAMNTAEIEAFTERLQCFDLRGIACDDAEQLAEKLVHRDREGDTRRLCAECLHCTSASPGAWRCGNHHASGIGKALAPDLALTLQHCAGFKPMRAHERQTT